MTEKVAIVGTVGVPGRYGGFETLAENLVRYHHDNELPGKLIVYCSGCHYTDRPAQFLGSDLRYIPLRANGVQSILYDSWSMIDARLRGCGVVVCLGSSAGVMLPIFRIFSAARVVSNVDGMEWRRGKWSWFARALLKFLEWLTVRCSHVVIADNECVARYIERRYRRGCELIEYGGDHATRAIGDGLQDFDLPDSYALGLCRIEPENNVALILQAFSKADAGDLVFVGNWLSSEYGRSLYTEYSKLHNIRLLGPVFDGRSLRKIRDNARIYIHGHSAGGTNPSLVEMMHFGIPIVAHDNEFNRATTEGRATYFRDASELRQRLVQLDRGDLEDVGPAMNEIALRRYTWGRIGRLYFDLISDP